ncbi:MAG: HNH endonuclease [Acidimicrobiia bacterium]|nr:HNH endonuclease [Acidimicrobiia bacterium]MDH5503936.1 HNH endonuclease [Acidimicrobiia bacterium]
METYTAGDGYDRSPDDIEQQILADELLIGRLRARQMLNIQLADEMQLAHADGCRTLTEWVASRTDTSRHTAKTLVMTARRFVDRPSDHMKLAAGEQSFERASVASRLNGSVDSDSYDIDSLRRIARRQKGITASEESVRFDERYLHIQPTLDDTAWKLWGQLAALDGAIVEQALFARADELPNDFTTARSTKTADALVAICQDSLDPIPDLTAQQLPTLTMTDDESEIEALPSLEALGRLYERTRPGITIFVNAQGAGPTVGTLMSGQLIGPNTLEEILCNGTIEAISVTDDGKPLNAGRRTAKIPGRLRKFVIGRDGGCCADGCTSRYRLQAHHRIHWADGGNTDADNLITLCWFHHHVVIHQRGFTITPDSPPHRLRFKPPLPNGP